MPTESHKEQVKELLGQSFSDDEVPKYPGRIYWHEGNFLTSFPHAPMYLAEVRFREANKSEGQDWTIYEARAIDSSNPKDSHGEWHRYTRDYELER